ncbi:MAG: hypothetical protein DCC57_04305 [Chloroflexi bacterium]|nr:MAG: hypothetical protein DCC57_04305 [Chloroflexota bacterium]
MLSIHAKTGRPFSKDTMRFMLQNQTYLGKICYQQTTYTGRGIRSRSAPIVWQEGQHPAIISLNSSRSASNSGPSTAAIGVLPTSTTPTSCVASSTAMTAAAIRPPARPSAAMARCARTSKRRRLRTTAVGHARWATATGRSWPMPSFSTRKCLASSGN